MSIISSLNKFVASKVSVATREKVVNLANTGLALLTSPIDSIKNLKQATQVASTTSTKSLLLQGATNVITVTGLGKLATSTVTAVKTGTLVPTITSAVKNLIPSTVKGKIIAGATVPIVASAVYNDPKLIVSAPSNVLNFQSDVGKLIADPNLENAKELITESPVISSLVAGATIASVGYGASSLISSYMNTQAVKENTQATVSNASNLPTVTEYSTASGQPIQIINQLPSQTPAVEAPLEVAPAGQTTVKKKKKKAKKKKKTLRSKKKTTKKKKKSTKKKSTKKKKSIKRKSS